MEFANSEEIRLLIDDDGYNYSSSSSLCLCRICHEEEEEKLTTMETPCACSGTLKYAHRGCIQRWCDEKGNTICEICLQKFEPGYTVPPKLALIDIAVTIRGSLEVPRLNYESQNTIIDDELDRDYAECAPTSHRGATLLRSATLILTIILVARHFVVVMSDAASHYPFTLATVFVLRASGILLPVYFILQIIAGIQKAQRQHALQMRRHAAVSHTYEVEDEEEVQQQTIQIQS